MAFDAHHQIRMSWRNMRHSLKYISPKHFSMKRWNIAGAHVRPKTMGWFPRNPGYQQKGQFSPYQIPLSLLVSIRTASLTSEKYFDPIKLSTVSSKRGGIYASLQSASSVFYHRCKTWENHPSVNFFKLPWNSTFIKNGTHCISYPESKRK